MTEFQKIAEESVYALVPRDEWSVLTCERYKEWDSMWHFWIAVGRKDGTFSILQSALLPSERCVNRKHIYEDLVLDATFVMRNSDDLHIHREKETAT